MPSKTDGGRLCWQKAQGTCGQRSFQIVVSDMPELAEVEVVRRGLEKALSERPKILKIEARRKDLRDPLPLRKLASLAGARVESVRRRAKYLIIETDRGSLISHLGMTGTWREARPEEALGTHDHIVIHLEAHRRLVYRDPRRFGFLDWSDEPLRHPKLRELGPEPLEDFAAHHLAAALRGRKTSIKAAIMDPAVVVGVGNIYASEALFLARIKPARKAHRLGKPELHQLVESIRRVLTDAIDAGGSTISDFAQASGERGGYQGSFRVYDRAGEQCFECREPIRRTLIAGRSTFWCHHCQR